MLSGTELPWKCRCPCDSAAKVISLCIDNAECRCCSHINDDQGTVILSNGCYRIDNPVCAQFFWIVIQDIQSRLDPGADQNRLYMEIAVRHRFQNRNDRRYDCRDDDIFHVIKFQLIQVEKRTKKSNITIGCLQCIRRYAPIFINLRSL